MVYSVNPDRPAPEGAGWSGLTLFDQKCQHIQDKHIISAFLLYRSVQGN